MNGITVVPARPQQPVLTCSLVYDHQAGERVAAAFPALMQRKTTKHSILVIPIKTPSDGLTPPSLSCALALALAAIRMDKACFVLSNYGISDFHFAGNRRKRSVAANKRCKKKGRRTVQLWWIGADRNGSSQPQLDRNIWLDVGSSDPPAFFCGVCADELLSHHCPQIYVCGPGGGSVPS